MSDFLSMEVPNHTTVWYQMLRKFKGNRCMWKPDTSQNMKLVTIEITGGDTLIPLIKGFLWGRRQIAEWWLQPILTAILSQTHKCQRPIRYTFAPKPISNDERLVQKNDGNLVNDNKIEKQQWRRLKLGVHLYSHNHHWGYFWSHLSRVYLNPKQVQVIVVKNINI